LMRRCALLIALAAGSHALMASQPRASARAAARASVRMPYIPDGLSSEQYEEIKRRDAAKMAGKDLGAWGPRFQRAAAPFWATQQFLAKTGALTSPEGLPGGPSLLWAWFKRSKLASVLYSWRGSRLAAWLLSVPAVLGSILVKLRSCIQDAWVEGSSCWQQNTARFRAA